MLSESDKKYLLSVARKSIASAVCGKPREPIKNPPPDLRKPAGAFVTIHKKGELRGCIGYIEAIGSLAETVQDAAIKAALEDYRFNPISPEEISEIEIEISVLTPLKIVNNIEEIEIGTHGIMIQHGYNRGLLLPQVAVEHGWDRETFLNQTARKAGLPQGAWKDSEAKIFSFKAEIFSDKQNI